MYNGYGIKLDTEGLQSFDNDIARNVIIFGVDNSSSSHVDNQKNNFLVLGEGTAFGINGIYLEFTMLIIVICLLMEKEHLNLKPKIKTLTFQFYLVLEECQMDLVLLSLKKYL